jgi:phosphatidylinositol-3-phosphatase
LFGASRKDLARVNKASEEKAEEPKPGEEVPSQQQLPSPRTAAFMVLAMLGLGVLLGEATDQIAQSAPLSTFVLEMPAASHPPATAPTADPTEVPQTATPEAPATPLAEAPLPLAPPLNEEALPEEPAAAPPPLELPEEESLPEVKHVFLIMLGENGFEETFGETSRAPYLSKELRAQGELLPNYFAVAKGELANQIAILSGQGPTPETATGCPNYADVAPGTESSAGQVEGNGCVYPAATPTLPGQMSEANLSWKAYVEGMEDAAAEGKPISCRHPLPGTPDLDQAPTPGDAYVTWRDPFAYFHAIVDGPDCAKNDVGLPQLMTDLEAKPEDFPALAYVVPDACHRGAEAPCEPGRPSGPAASEAFLKEVMPKIQGSFAYKDGGLIIITSAQARQEGEKPDTRGCCVVPAYPNLPPAPETPVTGPVREAGGGGQVGMLLLSPLVEPGSTSETYFNHYSLLATIEELFGLPRIGYAAEPAIVGFDESIFNAAS